MTRVFAKAAATAVAAVIASLAVVLVLVPLLGGSVDGNGLLMTVICPLLVAFPASAHLFWQKERLAGTLEALTVAHGKLAEAHARLAERARFDQMTGVLNRETFMAAMERPAQGAMLAIDADHFKRINDTHGHLAGDEALKLIADAIRRGVREGDLVGRTGGEEFAAFLDGACMEEASAIAERIRNGVAAISFVPAGAEPVALSVSVGASVLDANVSWAQALQAADNRLYEAKRAGRNRVMSGKGDDGGQGRAAA